jgi:ribonuclease P protein subunit RPR2
MKLDNVKHMLAEAQKTKDSTLAKRYVWIAQRMCTKNRIRMPRELKRLFCKYCNTYFKKGNYRVRTTGKTVTYTCLECGKCIRIGY